MIPWCEPGYTDRYGGTLYPMGRAWEGCSQQAQQGCRQLWGQMP